MSINSKAFKKFALITLGTTMTAFAISTFYLPNKIVNGGLSGVSTILFHFLNIQPGISFLAINAVLIFLALIFIGKEFVAKTLYGVVLLSVLVQVFSYLPAMTDDLFISSVIGAAIYGVGIGIVLASGGTTGGTDIIARLVQCVFPQVQVGNLLMAVDSIIVLVSLCLFRSVTLALYGIVTIFVSGFSINRIISMLNVSKLAFVVTEKGKEIAKKLISTSPRGVTIFNATGAYSMTDKQVLMCALKKSEMPDFQRKIISMDSEAFVIFSESQQILGNGFEIYK